MARGRSQPNMRLFRTQVEEPELEEMIRSLEANATDTVYAILRFVRTDVLAFLRSYTNNYRPPRYQRRWQLDENQRRIRVAKGSLMGWRPAHPGGWADVEGDLKAKYYARLEWVDGGWRLSIGNRSEHAVYVEAMDGFFVVHGVMEPRGPVARSIRRAIKALGLTGWKVVGPGGSAVHEDQAVLDVRGANAPAPTFVSPEG